MIMRSALYSTNTLSLIVIVITHWSNNPQIDMSPPLGHIFLIPSQPVFALSPEFCVLSGEATNTNFSLWFDHNICNKKDKSKLMFMLLYVTSTRTRWQTYDCIHTRLVVVRFCSKVLYWLILDPFYAFK